MSPETLLNDVTTAFGLLFPVEPLINQSWNCCCVNVVQAELAICIVSTVGVWLGVGVLVGVWVGVSVLVGVLVGVSVLVGVTDGVNVFVGVLVGVSVLVGVGVDVEVEVTVGVGVGVNPGVEVFVGVVVGLGVIEGVGVLLGVFEGVGVGLDGRGGKLPVLIKDKLETNDGAVLKVLSINQILFVWFTSSETWYSHIESSHLL